MIRIIGIRKVRHKTDRADHPSRVQCLHGLFNSLQRHTQTMHAGIDFEPDIQAEASGCMQQLGLPELMNDGL